MAFTGNLCTQLDITYKVGAYVSSDVTEAFYNSYVAMAEGIVNAATRYDWINATLDDTATAGILSDAVSSLAAIYAIQYDMSGYTSRGEAESMITILRDAFLRDISILRDIKTQSYMI